MGFCDAHKRERHLGEYLVGLGLVEPARRGRGTCPAPPGGRAARVSAVGAWAGVAGVRLYRALGDLWGVEACDLDDVDVELVRSFSVRVMIRDGWVPVRGSRNADGPYDEVLVAVAGRLQEDVVERVRSVTGARRVPQVVTTDWDIRRVVQDNCTEELLTMAVEGLAITNPDASAQRVITTTQ